MDKKVIIIESAIEVIAENGFYNTSVRMIANKAGISVGTIYNYFNNKDEILNHIFKTEFEKRNNLLNKLKESHTDFEHKITSFLDIHFEDLKENPKKAIVLVQESRIPQNHSLEGINDFMEKLPLAFSEMLNVAMKKKEIRVVNKDLIADVIFHMIREVAFKIVTNSNYDYTVAKEELKCFLWLGLKKE